MVLRWPESYAVAVSRGTRVRPPVVTELRDIFHTFVDIANLSAVVKATYGDRFEATDGKGSTSSGRLPDARQHTEAILRDVPAERTRPHGTEDDSSPAPLLSEVAASGPWFWAGSGPLGFLRGGVLVTPWGEGVWGVTRGSSETADADTVFADFANSQHNVKMHNPQCIRMSSRRKADGDRVGIDFAGTGADQTCQVHP